MDLKMIMEQDAREELERDGAACREVMQQRTKGDDYAFDVSLADTAFECSACGWECRDTTTCTTEDFAFCPHCGRKILF